MIQLLFRNRWAALLWAGSVMASMALFVSEDGGSQQVEAAAKQIKAQRQARSIDAMPPSPPAGFTPDEDLFVDEDAAGGLESTHEPQVRLVRSAREADAADPDQGPLME